MSTSAVIDGPRGNFGQVGIAREAILGGALFAEPVLLGHGRFGREERLVYGQEYFSDLEVRGILKIDNWRHIPTVQPQVILEPLKGRIITKPDAGQYVNMRKIQKGLWSYLQPFRQFALTGRPVEPEDIGYVGASWETGKKYVSGDFSAATDNLKSDLSRLVLGFALSKVRDQGLVYQMLQSFTSSRVRYKECFKKPTSKKFEEKWGDLYETWRCESSGTVQQTNGQLMGHVLSFPILCIVNYLAFKLSFRRMGREAPNVLVNGDDILFCAFPSEYESWKKTTVECGLYPSLGKNLFSDQVAQVNSTLYKVHNFEVSGVHRYRFCEEIPYFSFGLLLNRGKGKDRQDIVDIERTDQTDELKANGSIPALQKIYEALQATHLDGGRVKKLFTEQWGDKLRWLSARGCNLFQDDYQMVKTMLKSTSGNGAPSELRDQARACSYAAGLTGVCYKTLSEQQAPLRRVRANFLGSPFDHLRPDLFLDDAWREPPQEEEEREQIFVV